MNRPTDTPTAADVLAFERTWWSSGQPQDEAVRERLGLEPAAYRRLLAEVIDSAEGLEADPQLVRRLRRQRVQRRQERAQERLQRRA